MFKFLSPLAMAGVLLSLACLGAGPAQALSKATFVSGKGVDTGTCAETQPCRTFQFAIGQTIPGGAVKVLDPANYGAMIITQSISIAGIEGTGINSPAGDAIAINAGANDVVNLTHLTIDGLKTGNNGIVLNSGGSLTITHCVVRNFFIGIFLQPTGKTTFLIADSVATSNDNGVAVIPGSGASPQGTLDHVLMNENGFNGLVVNSGGIANVTSVESIASNNGNVGFFVESNGVLRLAHSTATANGFGVNVDPTSTAISFGDNHIGGNGTDVFGTLTNVGTQ